MDVHGTKQAGAYYDAVPRTVGDIKAKMKEMRQHESHQGPFTEMVPPAPTASLPADPEKLPDIDREVATPGPGLAGAPTLSPVVAATI